MNKVVLVGRLSKDPVLKFTTGTGTAVTSFNLAVDKEFKKENAPTADFIPVVVWGKSAEAVANYNKKGSLVAVSGRIETRSYDKDGSKVYVTEVVADKVQFLDSKKSDSSQSSIPDDYFGAVEDEGEDIPF